MLGRLCMPVEQAIEAYTKLVEKAFADRKVIGTSGPSEYKGKKLLEALKAMVLDATGNANEHMTKGQGDKTRCQT